MTITIETSIGQMISVHRKITHISQARLAEIAGVSRNYISLVERGKTENVSYSVLLKILDALNLEMHITMKDSKGE